MSTPATVRPGPAGAAAALGAEAPGPAVPAIQVVEVEKVYRSRDGDVRAVDGIDLSIDQGEFFSLLGPSGCGKTTTLRMIAGFEEPTSGHVLLYGADVTDVPPHRRDVNLVFQNYALFPHMTVFDNVAFGLARKGVARPEIRQRVTEALELVELAGRERRRPKELSGGQQQRVALARALVNRPRALLLDEPLGALDLKLRQAMQLELKRIQREVGITFVYVTHDQGEALTMSDRIVVMNNGRVEQLGTPRELYEQPGTKFVAGFIGTSNVLHGRVSRVTAGTAVLEAGPDERVSLPLRGSQGPGDAVQFSVRPEKILLTEQPPTGGCALRGTVREVVYLGTSTNYTVHVPSWGDLVVHEKNAGVGQLNPARGGEVWLGWGAEHGFQIEDDRDDATINAQLAEEESR